MHHQGHAAGKPGNQRIARSGAGAHIDVPRRECLLRERHNRHCEQDECASA
jgi:hypothetical protein